MDIILLALLSLVSAFVGTIAGFGISTIMVPVVVLFFPIPQALLYVGIIHFFGSLWKLLLFKKSIRLRFALGFGIPAWVASILGALLISRLRLPGLEKLLAIFLLIYVGLLLYNPKFRFLLTSASTIAGGSISGFLAGFFGIGGAIRSAFLSAYYLPSQEFIATNGLVALFVDIGRLGGYLISGVSLPSRLYLSFFLCIPLSFLGAWIAKKVVGRISKRKFRLVVGLFLLLLGVRLILY